MHKYEVIGRSYNKRPNAIPAFVLDTREKGVTKYASRGKFEKIKVKLLVVISACTTMFRDSNTCEHRFPSNENTNQTGIDVNTILAVEWKR